MFQPNINAVDHIMTFNLLFKVFCETVESFVAFYVFHFQKLVFNVQIKQIIENYG